MHATGILGVEEQAEVGQGNRMVELMEFGSTKTM